MIEQVVNAYKKFDQPKYWESGRHVAAGDTKAQSYPVFGLSHLLGINLMPRIRNIHDLFSGNIDFKLIGRHL